jgi:WXG100 family type VII secretion target
MAEKIKMNYPAMEEMAKYCDYANQQVLQTMSVGLRVAKMMRDGALVGDAGEAFAAALEGPYKGGCEKLAEKLREIAGDIRGAMADMKAADQGAAGKF